jgi:hypothetical protein
MDEKKKENVQLSSDCMITYIMNNGYILNNDHSRMNNILGILFYDEKDSISDRDGSDGGEKCVFINFNKIQSEEKIKQIYNIIYMKIESLKKDKQVT